jgi:hypothetical protein
MADLYDRINLFSAAFLKRDGDIGDRKIHRRHLSLDALASGVFASGYFDAIQIDGPTTAGYVLTADADGWGTWQVAANDHSALTNLEWSVAGHTIDDDIVPTASGTQDVGTQTIPFAEGNCVLLRTDTLYATDAYIGGGTLYVGGDTTITNDTIDIHHRGSTDTVVTINTNATTGYAIGVNAHSLTSGGIASYTSSSNDTTTRNLLTIQQTGVDATNSRCLFLGHSSTGNWAEQINTAGYGVAVVSTGTTQTAIQAQSDTLTTGRLGYFYSNSPDTNTRQLVTIHNDNTAANNTTALWVRQDAAHTAVTIAQSGDYPALWINGPASATQPCFFITSPATTTGRVLDIEGCDSLTTGSIAYFLSNSSDASARNLISISNSNASATGADCLYIQQASSGQAIYVDHNGGNTAMQIWANSLVGGGCLGISSNSSDATSRSLVSIANDHTSATGALPLYIKQDAATTTVLIDQNANAVGLHIDSEATSQASLYMAGQTQTTGRIIDLTSEDSLTTGTVIATVIAVHSNSSDNSSRHLVQINNDHADADNAVCLWLNQDGADNIIYGNGATLTAAGVWTDKPSTYDTKSNITEIPASGYIDKINDLKIFSFQKNVEIEKLGDSAPYHIGYILDDESTPDELKTFNKNGIIDPSGGLSAQRAISFLLATVKELAARVEELEAQI